jgi:hypothetical protein
MRRQPGEQYRFGIGEWYGLSFINLTPAQRRFFASLTSAQQKQQACLPRFAENPDTKCTKEGGVCSLRLYQLSEQGVSVASGIAGALRTTCPYRFREGMKVFHWIGEIILGHDNPIIAKEVGFLERPRDLGPGSDNVGRIDMVLVHPNLEPLTWCALEMQAVYFSGRKMSHEFNYIANHHSDDLPFPVINRRPDYRSSGPKRLMPQLQIKVPTLRRWGKKMAVVVDTSFIAAMGKIGRVEDITNCDIAWFVVKFNEQGPQPVLELDDIIYTTLEMTIEGLTGGTPVPLGEFERKIRRKLGRQKR